MAALELRSTLLAIALAFSAEAQAAPRPTIAVVPFEGIGQAIGDLGYAAALSATGALEAERAFNLLHMKQYLRTAEDHEGELERLDRAKALKRVGTYLGASWILTGSVETFRIGKVVVNLEIIPVKSGRATSAKIEKDDVASALRAIPVETFALVKKAGVPGAKAAEEIDPYTISPASENVDALLAYAACHRVLVRQPMGIRNPTILEGPIIEEATDHCTSAMRLDPEFADAKAALGLALALKGKPELAEQHLASVRESKVFLPFYWLAKFWILSRHHDPELAVSALQQVLLDRPGFLIARGYLGETLMVLGKNAEALQVFEQYLEAVPEQPWVMSRIGYALSKLGRADEAVEWSRKSLRISPTDSELLLELASRLVDANKLEEAKAVLKRIVADGGARGEVHLRLGYVHLLLNDLPAAEKELYKALEKANRPSEWRTRGRARYDLAKMWMRQNVPENALRQLKLAVQEGFHDPVTFESDPDFKPLLGDSRFRAITEAEVHAPGHDRPGFVSPFPVDPKTGGIDVRAARGAKTKDKTVILRF